MVCGLGEGGNKDRHPVDTFARLLPASLAAAVPGLTSDTLTPWRVGSGSFTITGGVLSAPTSTSCKMFVPVKYGKQGGVSRSITVNVTTIASGRFIYDGRSARAARTALAHR